MAGVPVGREIPEEAAYAALESKRDDRDFGSIIVVVATDAPAETAAADENAAAGDGDGA